MGIDAEDNRPIGFGSYFSSVRHIFYRVQRFFASDKVVIKGIHETLDTGLRRYDGAEEIKN